MFAALCCTALFSFSIVCAHRTARTIGGTEANFWRLACAALLLGTWSYAFGIGLGGDAFPMFLLSGVAGIGIGDIALFQALPRLGPRLSSLLINCLTAPLGALLEWLWLRTSLTPSQLLCGVVILAGVGIALAPGRNPGRTRRELIVGTSCCVLSAIAGAVGAVLSRKAYAIAHDCQQPLDGANAAFQRVMGGLFLAGLCLLIVKRHMLRVQAQAPYRLVLETARHKWRGIWYWVVFNGVAGQTFGVSFMQRALETTPTGIVLAIIATTPVVIIPFAYAIEAERPSTHSVLGGLLAVAGVIALVLLRYLA